MKYLKLTDIRLKLIFGNQSSSLLIINFAITCCKKLHSYCCCFSQSFKELFNLAHCANRSMAQLNFVNAVDSNHSPRRQPAHLFVILLRTFCYPFLIFFPVWECKGSSLFSYRKIILEFLFSSTLLLPLSPPFSHRNLS